MSWRTAGRLLFSLLALGELIVCTGGGLALIPTVSSAVRTALLLTGLTLMALAGTVLLLLGRRNHRLSAEQDRKEEEQTL